MIRVRLVPRIAGSRRSSACGPLAPTALLSLPSTFLQFAIRPRAFFIFFPARANSTRREEK
jgi:hypothetical protein